MIPLYDAAKILDVSPQYLQAEIKRGKIPGARMYFRRWLIPESWVARKQKRKAAARADA